MPRRVLLCLLLLITLGRQVSAQAPVEAEATTSIAITPFASTMLGEDAWLGKAIADLLARKLATIPGYILLERARLQSFLDELELQESGLVGQQDAQRLGGVARVDQVIYGNFRRSGDALTIDLILVDLPTQTAVQKHSVQGQVDRLQDAAALLAKRIVENQGRVLSDAERQSIDYRPTDSSTALQRFYEGLDHLDQGHIEDSFGAFYSAVERDGDYYEARLWMALALQQLAHDQLAAIAFQEVVNQAGRRVEGHDARLFLAEMLEDTEPDRTIDLYSDLLALQPRTPHSLEAAYRLADLHERRGDHRAAYDLWSLIDRYVEEAQQHPEQFVAERSQEQRPNGNTLEEFMRWARQYVGLATEENGLRTPDFIYADSQGIRHSQFFTWDHAIGLYREAIARMALLYPKVAPKDGEKADAPPAPRGTFLVSPDNPVVTEPTYGETPSLFFGAKHESGEWKESLYAVVVPEGYIATGAELRVTGRMLKSSTNRSFGMRLFPLPMPPNYHNAWIAALYGQTANVSTLEKYVPFHGRQHRYLTLQLVENQSEIYSWELRLTLEAVDNRNGTPDPSEYKATATEGQILSRVPNGDRPYFGPTQPQFRYLSQPRRGLAIVDNYEDGLTLITARGEIGNKPTDLWSSRSLDGKEWTVPEPLATNGVSEDYAPQLLRSEDGGLRLFWLSNRRGRGWEIWTSKLPRGERVTWSQPSRVPLEDFLSTKFPPSADLLTHLPHFSAVQDSRGRWVLVYQNAVAARVLCLTSRDGEKWELSGDIEARPTLQGLTLTEDASGVFDLLGIDGSGGLTLWRSKDLKSWKKRDAPSEVLFRPRYGFNYASYLFPEPGGRLVALLSDSIYGLQFARFDPNGAEPVRDLVPQITLETFAAAQASDGGYLIATEDADGITVRRYGLARPKNSPRWPLSSPLYTEATQDSSGHRWSRTIAGARIVLPDVTAVAAQPGGRIWWGIETGVFSAHDDTFLFSDVSMGYPFHTTTDIEPCGETIYFASRFSSQPRVAIGKVAPIFGQEFLKTEVVSLDTSGRITSLACRGDGSLYIGTSAGEVFTLSHRSVASRRKTDGTDAVSAIAVDPRDGSAFIATERGTIYLAGDGLAPLPSLPSGDRPVQAMAVDASGTLWVAVRDAGLFRLDHSGWHGLSDVAQSFPRFSVAALAVDSEGKLWLLPHPETLSNGIARFDGDELAILNPPHRRLATPVDMAIAGDGAVWIGTSDDGLYRLEMAQ